MRCMRIERYLVAVEALEEHNGTPPTAREVSESIQVKQRTAAQALAHAADEGLLITGVRLVRGGERTATAHTFSISEAGEAMLEEPEWE